MKKSINHARGCLLGLAIGDAVGTTLEFTPKQAVQPIVDMVGGGPFDLQPGQWTDDTSMMLCLADSLLAQGLHDPRDQMDRYLRWYHDGENSCTGHCFDIGNTVRSALKCYQQHRDGTPYVGACDEFSAGNGSLMRIAPIALAYWQQPVAKAMAMAADSSRTTHGEARAVDACQLMTYLLHQLLNQPVDAGTQPNSWLRQHLAQFASQWQLHDEIQQLCSGEFIGKAETQIHGSGFVVRSLEAALWCFAHARDFADGTLLAANLGEDADTTAAIYGMLAGAFWGEAALPVMWLRKLAWRGKIGNKAEALLTVMPVSLPTAQAAQIALVEQTLQQLGFEAEHGRWRNAEYDFWAQLNHSELGFYFAGIEWPHPHQPEPLDKAIKVFPLASLPDDAKRLKLKLRRFVKRLGSDYVYKPCEGCGNSIHRDHSTYGMCDNCAVIHLGIIH
ncbi:ADP-ribosylglycohydrolase family protein [Ferrimonas senticii]|uniref:ADP-ribosylglycohydrolase family protein n=1 Tax=Ferrimonas senticii TaxID=394566 RepID=UPI000414CD00|nr:ADP-ribosylglycohydrolase family protein [Ferrimonas senticii]